MSTSRERTPSRMESSIVPELVLDRTDQMGSLPGSEPIRTAHDPATGRCRIEIDRVGRFRFTAGAPEVHAQHAPGASPATVRAAYLATVLPLALQAAGHQLLHASAIDTPEGVIAFCGPSGAGKSTLAAALARRGHPQWADDAVWWEVETDEHGEPIGARTRRLPFQRRLRPDAERWLGIDRQEQADGADVGNTSLRRLRPLRAAYLLASALPTACRAANCGICIVIVRGDGLGLAPPGPDEQRFLDGLGVSAGQRLGCQVHAASEATDAEVVMDILAAQRRR
jgi:ferredoxin